MCICDCLILQASPWSRTTYRSHKTKYAWRNGVCIQLSYCTHIVALQVPVTSTSSPTLTTPTSRSPTATCVMCRGSGVLQSPLWRPTTKGPRKRAETTAAIVVIHLKLQRPMFARVSLLILENKGSEPINAVVIEVPILSNEPIVNLPVASLYSTMEETYKMSMVNKRTIGSNGASQSASWKRLKRLDVEAREPTLYGKPPLTLLRGKIPDHLVNPAKA
ncbi:hypothetical protein DFJ77DRAFT_140227 [Powellomyces hirtus]|nr:hypothetical protein DFJ77DRAFT_140227 [Powellomyces hirtus]